MSREDNVENHKFKNPFWPGLANFFFNPLCKGADSEDFLFCGQYSLLQLLISALVGQKQS